MENVAGIGLEPAHGIGGRIATHDADIGALLGLPRERRTTAHGALEASGQWQDWKADKVLRYEEVVDHAHEWRREHVEPCDLAVTIDDSIRNLVGEEILAGHVTEEDKLARFR